MTRHLQNIKSGTSGLPSTTIPLTESIEPVLSCYYPPDIDRIAANQAVDELGFDVPLCDVNRRAEQIREELIEAQKAAQGAHLGAKEQV